jgi:hypothetical protein
LSLVGGVRWEQVKGDYSAYSLTTNNSNQNGLQGAAPAWRTINVVHVNLFPSINIKYKLNENVQFFGAYYGSTSRPNFSDLSPLVNYNVGTSNSINASSNPYLRPTLAYNYDLGGSIFSNDVGLFSVDFFYKELVDVPYAMPGYMPSPDQRALIYNAPSNFITNLPPVAYFDTAFLDKSAGNKMLSCTIPINNPEKAFDRGIELSWQTHFWYLPGVLSGLVFDLNVSFMSSNALYPYLNNGVFKKDSVFKSGKWNYTYWNAYFTRAGSLLNMPDATYNAIIGWDYLGFSSRVSFRYQKTTLTYIDSRYSLADAYYDNVLLTDIMVKQKLTDHLSVFANFTNIGAHIDTYYENTPAGQLPTSAQTYGFNAQFGASYAF